MLKVTGPHQIGSFENLYLFESDYVSECLLLTGGYESHLQELFKVYLNQDSVCLDGGAYIGWHSICMSRIAAHVFAFEPIQEHFQLLKRNVESNNCNNVTITEMGLSDMTGKGVIHQQVMNNNGATALRKEDSGNLQFTTIDLQHFSRLDFIKLDLEGFEKLALYGGLETIKKFRPTIVLECWSGWSETSIDFCRQEFKFLLDLDYTVQHIYVADYLFVPF